MSLKNSGLNDDPVSEDQVQNSNNFVKTSSADEESAAHKYNAIGPASDDDNFLPVEDVELPQRKWCKKPWLLYLMIGAVIILGIEICVLNSKISQMEQLSSGNVDTAPNTVNQEILDQLTSI